MIDLFSTKENVCQRPAPISDHCALPKPNLSGLQRRQDCTGFRAAVWRPRQEAISLKKGISYKSFGHLVLRHIAAAAG